jgi:hypothetical protein
VVLTTGPVDITETTTNVATAIAAGGLCTASDSVTVTLEEPTCDVSVEFDKLEDDKLKYKLTNSSGIIATLDTFVLNFPMSYGVVEEIKLDGAIYKASDSNLVVGPNVMIGADDWTEEEVSKRELEPGETRTLEIIFTEKGDRGEWDGLPGAGGMMTFEESCEVPLRAPNACEIDKPTELVFEYTGDACSATTNFQGGKFICYPADGGPIGSLVGVKMRKDAEDYTVSYTADGFSIRRTDDPGKEFPSEIRYSIVGTMGTQFHVLHTSCSQTLNIGDQFGAAILRQFIPRD